MGEFVDARSSSYAPGPLSSAAPAGQMRSDASRYILIGVVAVVVPVAALALSGGLRLRNQLARYELTLTEIATQLSIDSSGPHICFLQVPASSS